MVTVSKEELEAHKPFDFIEQRNREIQAMLEELGCRQMAEMMEADRELVRRREANTKERARLFAGLDEKHAAGHKFTQAEIDAVIRRFDELAAEWKKLEQPPGLLGVHR